MAIQLSDVLKGERTIDFEWDGEMAEVTYRTAGYTPEVEDAFRGMLETDRPLNAVASVLSKLLVRWDVLDVDGEPLDVDFETLGHFPSEFLNALMVRITEDQGAGREDRKNSDGGSRARANSGNARHGTR